MHLVSPRSKPDPTWDKLPFVPLWIGNRPRFRFPFHGDLPQLGHCHELVAETRDEARAKAHVLDRTPWRTRCVQGNGNKRTMGSRLGRSEEDASERNATRTRIPIDSDRAPSRLTRGPCFVDVQAYPSRVVFVSVLGPNKVRRKAAIGIAEGMDWNGFLRVIQGRLKVPSVKAVYMKESMSPVTTLEVLQDIDDLVIEAGEAPPPAPEPSGDHGGGLLGTASRFIRSSTAGSTDTAIEIEDGGRDAREKSKYGRRTSYLRRLGMSLFGGETSVPELPRVGSSTNGKDGVKRRKRRAPMQPHNLMFLVAILLCTATLILLYLRISSSTD